MGRLSIRGEHIYVARDSSGKDYGTFISEDAANLWMDQCGVPQDQRKIHESVIGGERLVLDLNGVKKLHEVDRLPRVMSCDDGHNFNVGDEVFRIGSKYYCPKDGTRIM